MSHPPSKSLHSFGPSPTPSPRVINSNPARASWLKKVIVIVGVVALLLILVQLVSSPVLTSQVNRKLGGLPGYAGHVGAVHLALWRGVVSASDFVLFQKGHEADGPVLKTKRSSFTLGLGALLRGRIAGRVAVDGVEILMIQSPRKPSAEAAEKDRREQKKNREQAGRAWQAVLLQDLPFEISRFEASNVQVKFVDRSRPTSSEMLLEQMHLVAHDFKTRPSSSNDLPARLEVDGHFHGGGDLTVRASADATSADPLFKATMEVKALVLPPMNDFLKAYALADVSRGTFEMFLEVNAKGGHYDGYIKPFLKDLEFKAVPDPEKNLLRRAAAKVASAAQELLKNDTGKVATKAPFQGDFSDNKLDVWTTLENLLRNAFVSSLREGFENQKPTA